MLLQAQSVGGLCTRIVGVLALKVTRCVVIAIVLETYGRIRPHSAILLLMIKRSLAPASLLLALHPLVPKRCRRRLIIILSVPTIITSLDHIRKTSTHQKHVLQLQVTTTSSGDVIATDHIVLMLVMLIFIKNCNVRLAGVKRAIVGVSSQSDVEHLLQVVKILCGRERAD